MDKFPDEFGKVYCFKKLTENQKNLMKQTRKEFYETILKAVQECSKTVRLNFSEMLWTEHRIDITCELLEKFGEVTIYAKNGKATITKITTNKEDIPNSIESLKIEF